MTIPLLTLVTDRRTATMPLPTLARHALEGGVDVVQIREGDLDDVDLDQLVADVITAVGADRVAINDAPALAARHGTHLHLPERSTARYVAAAGIPSLSCSVHAASSLEHIPAAATYLVLGHLFTTSTHPASPPLGRCGARAIVAASPLPVVVIGGITPDNVASASATGAAGVAVMSYVNSSPKPKAAARKLRDALERSMSQQAVSLSVQVNGKPMSVAPQTSLTSFLERRNFHPRLVVVERNREIVAKSAYDSTLLQEGDLLEIAHFVGGG